jgi:hypothetical protein
MQRTWPIMIVEIGNNGPTPGPIFSPVGCVQAVNSTSNNSTTGNTSTSSTGTTSNTATSTSAVAGSSTTMSAAMSCKVDRRYRFLGLVAILFASILAS